VFVTGSVMARIKDVVVDCDHLASLARFWAAAVDGYRVAPYDDAELARLWEMGIDDPEDDPGVMVEPPEPGLPRLWFQKVPESKRRSGSWVTLRDPEGNEFCIDAA
jgi:hypothetical protein